MALGKSIALIVVTGRLRRSLEKSIEQLIIGN